MKFKFCLLNKDLAANGSNVGWRYVLSHKNEWIDAPTETGSSPTLAEYLTVGYMRGSDFLVYDGKVYTIKKSFIVHDESTIVLLCTESVQGCDLVD